MSVRGSTLVRLKAVTGDRPWAAVIHSAWFRPEYADSYSPAVIGADVTLGPAGRAALATAGVVKARVAQEARAMPAAGRLI
ncbi:hypothetical protein [Actinoallomurus acaciae]|uniref:Uncharacterized protein n=1 Tax=Actinoallomurus acaciae TaxID=502577 RepID=A0ABV5YY26_9ACTN